MRGKEIRQRRRRNSVRAALLTACGFAAFTAIPHVVRAAPIFTDSFETYTGGGATLDKNVSGANAAPNGSGNPWFGPSPPNFKVVATEGGVVPHSGTQMVRGNAASQGNQLWYNAQYRTNGGAVYHSNVQLDFWFYDPNGAGASSPDYQDHAGLSFYDTNASSTDYNSGGNLNAAVNSEQLAVGAADDQLGSFNDQVYQVHISGASGGYDTGSGWFNTTKSRTIGWHQGRIVVGQANGSGISPVQFYIDNLGSPVMSGSTGTNLGLNVVELDGFAGATNGYFDDVSVTIVPEPATIGGLLAGCGLMMLRSRRTRR